MQEFNPLVGAKRSYPGGTPQKYVLDDYKRELIISLYDSSYISVETIAERIGVPSHMVSKWASELGVARNSNKRWTEKETAYLKRNFGKKTLEHIAAQLHRLPNTVYVKARTMGLAGSREGYSKADLVMAFGVAHKTLDNWVEKGLLKGKKTGNSSNSHWEFSEKQVRDFIIAHPDKLNPRRIDWLWIVDILSGERGIGRLDNPYETEEEA